MPVARQRITNQSHCRHVQTGVVDGSSVSQSRHHAGEGPRFRRYAGPQQRRAPEPRQGVQLRHGRGRPPGHRSRRAAPEPPTCSTLCSRKSQHRLQSIQGHKHAERDHAASSQLGSDPRFDRRDHRQWPHPADQSETMLAEQAPVPVSAGPERPRAFWVPNIAHASQARRPQLVQLAEQRVQHDAAFTAHAFARRGRTSPPGSGPPARRRSRRRRVRRCPLPHGAPSARTERLDVPRAARHHGTSTVRGRRRSDAPSSTTRRLAPRR